MSLSVEERLQRLEDREAISRLLMEYKRRLDARDLAAYSRLFARDGEWWGRTGRARGPEAIRAMLEEKLTPSPPAPGPTDYHLMTNESIELNGDQATAESTFVVITRSEQDTPIVRLLGRYQDQLVREDGEWRFASRRVHMDVPDFKLVEPS